MICFGVDIGGTTVKLGMFSVEGELLEKWEIPTRKENAGANIIFDICTSMDKHLADAGYGISDVKGVGVGVPGPVMKDGTVNGCVNLGWGVFNIERAFADSFHGIPCKAGNDANVAALGEYFKGGGRGYSDMLMITLGTGVGGGVILDGRIVAGCAGGAGEIGHMPVAPGNTERCNCGKNDCLELVASATGIVREARKAMKNTDTPSQLRDIIDITAKDVIDNAKAGDKLALSVMDIMGDALARAIANVACTVNMEAVVIGGGVSKAGAFLLDFIEDKFKKVVFAPCSNVKFLMAELGNDGGIYGAAALILK